MVKHRSGRINEEIKKELSNIIQYEIRDPRITAMVSVTSVEVTKDLRYAKAFISIFGNDDVKNATLSILKKSAGFMRKEIGHRINLRFTPEIILELDSSIEHGMHIDSLLHQIRENNPKDTSPKENDQNDNE